MLKGKETDREKRIENVYVGVVSLATAGLFGWASYMMSTDVPVETRRAMIEHGPEIMSWSFRIAAAGNLVNAGYRFARVIKEYLA